MSTHRFRLSASSPSFLALGCVGMITSALPAHAQAAEQDGKGPANLGGMTVTDTAITEGSYKTDKLDSPKYTAPLVDTPRSITVIGSQLIKDTASASLAEALRTVPGITMGAGEGGNPLGDRPFIRGFDSQASTYLDGVRDIGAQSREVFDVDQIEVVKGSDSVTNGSGNAGGSINIVSKQPTSERFIQADGSYGNADYKRATIDINQPINDFIGLRLNGMYHDQNVAGRDAIWQKRWGIAPSIKIGLTGPTSLTVSYYHLHTSELPDSGIPYLYTLANEPAGVTQTSPVGSYTTAAGQQVTAPRNAFYGLVDRDFRKTTTNDFTIRAQHEFDNGFIIRNTSRYSGTKQAYIWTQPDDQQGNVYATGQVWRRANTRYGREDGLVNQTDLSGKFDTGGIRHSIAASLEYSHQQSSYGTFVTRGNVVNGNEVLSTGSTISPRCNATTVARYYCTSVGNPNPNDAWTNYASDTSSTQAAIVRSLPKTRTLSNSSTASASLFDTITVTDWLLFNLGGRYDHYSTNASAGLTSSSTASRTWVSKKDNIWTYQAGVVLKPLPNGSVYFSTSKAATPPGAFLAQGAEDNAITTVGLDPNALKVQKTTSYEVGTKWELFDNNLLVSLAAFQTKTVNARATDANNLVTYIGTKRIRGIELSYNGNITPNWNVYGGYTYMPSKILNAGMTTTSGLTYVSASTGKAFPNTPKNSFTTFTNYKITPKFTLGGGAIYMSKVYGGYSALPALQNGVVVITKTRATYVPSYWRFDATASYQLTDMIKLQINALNVGNKRYFDKAYAAHYANEAAGRTVIGTVSFRY